MYSRRIRKGKIHTKNYFKKHSRKNKKHKKYRITHKKKLHKGGNAVIGAMGAINDITNEVSNNLLNSKPAKVIDVAFKAGKIVANAAGPTNEQKKDEIDKQITKKREIVSDMKKKETSRAKEEQDKISKVEKEITDLESKKLALTSKSKTTNSTSAPKPAAPKPAAPKLAAPKPAAPKPAAPVAPKNDAV